MSGVEIGGMIKPLGGALKAVFEDVDGKGTWRSVADATARDAIILDCQKVGMLVFQIDTLTLYRITATGSPPTYIAVSLGGSAPGGTGWVKVLSSAFSVVSSIVAADVSDFATAVNARLAAYSSLTASQVSDFASAVSARIAATAPTGTGFSHYIAGVRDAAAKLIDLAADVSGSLPAASVSGLTSAINTAIGAYTTLTASQVSDFAAAVTARIAATAPTGNGFARYVAGVRNEAAQLIDLANDINTSTVLPDINGGGALRRATQQTSASTPLLLGSSDAIPSNGAGYMFASVLFKLDSNGLPFTMDVSGLYQNSAGTITNIYGPNPSTQLGTLLNQVATLVINSTTKKIELYGTNTGGTSVSMVPDLLAKVG